MCLYNLSCNRTFSLERILGGSQVWVFFFFKVLKCVFESISLCHCTTITCVLTANYFLLFEKSFVLCKSEETESVLKVGIGRHGYNLVMRWTQLFSLTFPMITSSFVRPSHHRSKNVRQWHYSQRHNNSLKETSTK